MATRKARFPGLVLAAFAAGTASALAAGPTDAQIRAAYRARCESLLGEATRVDTRDLSRGSHVCVAACLQRRVNVAWANGRLARLDAGPPSGDMFWMYPVVTAMVAGRDAMSAANSSRLRELWRTYFPYRGDTENHWLLYYASLCLAAESNPGAGPGAWFNAKSSAENIAEARSYIEDWIRITTAYGQGEFNSPNYIEEYVAPLALLAGWEADPVFRREARMMLDYVLFDYAVEQLEGAYAGAHSRVYPWQVVRPGATPAAALGWLLFGLGERQPRDTLLILALSGYEPPPILWRIARERGAPYTDRQFKRTRWRMRHAGPEAFGIGGRETAPVYKQTFVDGDFALGSCQGGPLQSMQQQTWSLVWRTPRPLAEQNTFFGLQPYSSPLVGTMYYVGRWDTVVHAISTGPTGKLDYDSPDKLEGGSPHEQVFQSGPALVALYDIPAGTRFPIVSTFFSRDLDRVDEDPSGWIFCQGGPAYFGFRPLARGEWKPAGWTGHLAGLKGSWFAAGFADYTRGDRCLVSGAPRNGSIVQAAAARDWRSFGAFKSAVRALPLAAELDPVPAVRFTTLDGTRIRVRFGTPPEADGVPADLAHWPLFESPFGYSARGSRFLTIRHGDERLVLDFRGVAGGAQ
jgi:hypothetical protein